MEFIQPNKISGEILTLFDEADEFVNIVSPYYKIGKWYKLQKKILALKERSINVSFYVRSDEHDSITEILNLGFNYKEIPNLHCKLYFNEKYAIIASMNLLLSSEINSLEIGYKTTTTTEYREIITFFERYIDSSKKKQSTKEEVVSIERYEELYKTRSENYNELTLQTKRNKYECFMWERKSENVIRINGVLTQAQFEFAGRHLYGKTDKLYKFELIEGGKNYYNTIWGTSTIKFVSDNIAKPKKSEQEEINKHLAYFVKFVEDMKISVNPV